HHELRDLETLATSPMASTSPFDNVPLELLIEIFIYCLPTSGFASARTNCAPMNISSVCQSWRRLSVSTPKLW
ncbi:hypothetical protein BD410DRAFT_681655, partial [Rickenella mellea]